ncbi:MAG: flagellar hook-associated protein FlgK [Alphaproteobacteria bacterium]|nr:flagellar hook-associated protein FlgK [Alphaproteobacteria bacterium]
MSIQGALLTSLSSLNVLGQQTNLISNNIANANTPGYAQENLQLSELLGNGMGSGVVAGQVSVLANDAAAAVANQASGSAAYSQQMSSALAAYTSALGQPSDTSSLSSQLSAFTTALTTLSATPADGTAQSGAVNAAQSLTQTFNSLSGSISSQREQADQAIAVGVASVNNTLNQLAQNETARQVAQATGQSTANFINQRSQLLSNLATELPIQVHQSGGGGITVTTDRGTTLYDGSVHPLSFTATPVIPSSMRVTADPSNGLTGGLSQVSADGQPIAMSQSGSIAANLQLRDVTLPGFSDQLDLLAGNLIGTFQTADPTVSAGQAGLFTAGGAALDTTNPAAIAGLAANISVNSMVDPSRGGATWRITTGVQAASQGTTSNNSTLIGFVNALQSSQSATAIAGLPTAASLSDAVSQVSGDQQAASSTWTSLNTSRTQQATAAQTALSNQTGVNIDDQMQRLLIVQQTYQASAEVIQTASSMMNSLLSIIQA